MVDCIDLVYSKTETELLRLSNWVQSVMKTKYDNDMTDRIGAVYAKNGIKLSWPIQPSVVYDENQTKQQRDWIYRWGLHQKWYWTLMTDRIGCWLWQKPNNTTTWLIIWMQSTVKTKPSYYFRLDWVQSGQTRQWHDQSISLVYGETEIELSGLI